MRFRWSKDRAGRRQGAPDRPSDETRDDTRHVPLGPPAAGRQPDPPYQVPDYAVPDYRVPDYRVPEYSGPDLTAPDLTTPDLTAPDLSSPATGSGPGWASSSQGGPARQETEWWHGPPTPGSGSGRHAAGPGTSPPLPPATTGPAVPSYTAAPGPGPERYGARSMPGPQPPQTRSPQPDEIHGTPVRPASGAAPQGGRAPAPSAADPARHGGAPSPAQPWPTPVHGASGRHAAPPSPYQGPVPADRRARPGPSWPGSTPGAAVRTERIVIDRPAVRFEPKPPPADPYRPDTVFDGWSTSQLTVRLASVRGDAHRSAGLPRQDDVVVACHEPTGTVVFAVADGVSAAPRSHVGAALACRTAVNDLLVQLDEDRPGPDWSRVVRSAAYQLLMRVAGGREPDEQDRVQAVRTLATTLVTGTVAPTRDGALQVTLVRAGDSSAWCLHQGRYAPLLHDEDPGADGVSSTAVVALPRIAGQVRPLTRTLPGDAVLLVGTDGFGVPLGDGTGLVGQMFARELTVPPVQPGTLARLLDFSRETFDDDRTLLAVWSRHRLPGEPGEKR
ncbi:protein phosphatase 2C domain-containing protein [Streptomyces sp. WAC00469]|uniref:protein phosphatase 2C domain-containing protein n=1 Tax=Streptomyces sp. WAC00469 TaxID=2487415 RepID=UPI000F738248|nr:protein phosphatase 2C domain-containing protein [Streptomyces sp. WAC00469]RSS05069.1 hypothetical protein EF917_10880 [Streptomyces sp. WAC00469]